MSDNDNESDTECSETEDSSDYYNLICDDTDIESINQEKCDPEHFEFECLTVDQVSYKKKCSFLIETHFFSLQVKSLLNELAETLIRQLSITQSLAKHLLHSHNWALDSVVQMYLKDPSKLLVESKIKPEQNSMFNKTSDNTLVCPICFIMQPKDVFYGIGCSHLFCKECWNSYLENNIMHSVSTGRMYFRIKGLL